LATCVLWRWQESLARLASRLGMTLGDEDASRFSSWLNAVNVMLGIAAYALSFNIVFNFESLSHRLIASTISFAIPISMALLVNISRNQRLITAKGDEFQAAEEKLSEGAG